MTHSEIRKNIKANAKLMLRGNWGRAIGVIAILVVVSFIASAPISFLNGVYPVEMLSLTDGMLSYNVPANMASAAAVGGASLISLLISFFVVAPLSFGILRWFFNLSKGEKPAVASAFDYFGSGRMYARSLKTYLGMYWRILVYSIPYAIGITIMAMLMVFAATSENALFVAAAVILGIVIALAAFLYYFWAVIRLELMPYNTVRYPELKNKENYTMSVELLYGHKWEYVKFILSFFGWILLSTLTCGLLLIYVVPYMTASEVLFYNYLHSSADTAAEQQPIELSEGEA